jgi:hypothetical protein
MEITDEFMKQAFLELPVCTLNAQNVLQKAEESLKQKEQKPFLKAFIPIGAALAVGGIVVGSLYGSGYFDPQRKMLVSYEYGLNKIIIDGSNSFTITDSWVDGENLLINANVNICTKGTTFSNSALTIYLNSTNEYQLPIDFNDYITRYGLDGWVKDENGYSFTVTESNIFSGSFIFSYVLDSSSKYLQEPKLRVISQAMELVENNTDETLVFFYVPTNGNKASSIVQPTSPTDWNN